MAFGKSPDFNDPATIRRIRIIIRFAGRKKYVDEMKKVKNLWINFNNELDNLKENHNGTSSN